MKHETKTSKNKINTTEKYIHSYRTIDQQQNKQETENSH